MKAMRAARLITILALFATAFAAAAAAGGSAAVGSAPKNVHGFLLRPNESASHTFPRTPAFAWNPVRGAMCYELQLATSRSFQDGTVVWSNVSSGTNAGRICGGNKLNIPAASISLTLPWFTGKPYALYAHVRAVTGRGPSAWSKPFGFNMRWEELPVPMAARPGLVRWKPVDGATSYQVWYTDIRKTFSTHTNVADQRELYIFHDDPNWYSTVRWRVRAVRHVLGEIPNGLPAVSYGPWSPVYATTNPSLTSGPLVPRVAVSDVVSTGWRDAAHQLMPALTFSGADDLNGTEWPLFRVYAFTDRDCVNVVFRGSVFGGPAFAPRTSGPLTLPTSTEAIDLATIGVLASGDDEGAKTVSADGTELTSNESKTDESSSVRVDLPDVDAKTTRYFWTVVPVGISVTDSGAFQYVDVDLPQDACEAGRVSTFAKLSKPAITASRTPYVSGLTPKGRLLAIAGSRPVVYSTPLVTWQPVVGATSYEVQWSRTTYPWRTVGKRETLATASLLNISPGLWYYRVRGLNAAQVGTPGMTWSTPAAVRVVRPKFRVASR
ncbi:MAG: hypothetical protein H0U46_03540 [Actinobacteria bacterium]|nr:hypothetical protein [Actinomycetota bacterium]